jgi:hypothetical protein
MSRCITLITLFAALAHAQAPIERRPPAASVPFSNWPKPDAVSRHALLVVTTFDDDSPHLCRLQQLEPYRITCLGSRNQSTAIFDREQVRLIGLAPRGYTAVKIAEGVALGGGVPPLAIGLACGGGGGSICPTPVIVGVSLLVTGGVLHLVNAHRQHQPPGTIYIAMSPPTRETTVP